jgi:hypothetical protein
MAVGVGVEGVIVLVKEAPAVVGLVGGAGSDSAAQVLVHGG